MPEQGEQALVRLVAVTKRYGDRSALDGVSLAVHPERLLAVIGPSGSGKTTMLNVLLGWEHPDEGSVERSPAVEVGTGGLVPWTAVSVIPQQGGLLADLTLWDNIELPLRLTGGPDARRTGAQLAALGLTALAHRRPDEVSLGEQQRASVARALVLGPALVLADEPTAHQDAVAAELVLAVLGAAVDAGAACVMVTHDVAAQRRADVVVELADGKVRPLP